MELKNKPVYELVDLEKRDWLLKLYYEFNHLKSLYRQGRLKDGVGKDKCESVADHCFGVALLCLVLVNDNDQSQDLDLEKVLVMALIHEAGEVYGGDFSPHDNLSKEERLKIEKESAVKVFKDIPKGGHYLKVWDEFNDNQTAEAKFVNEIDQLEMMFEAVKNELTAGVNFQSYIEYGDKKIDDLRLKKIVESIKKFRQVKVGDDND